MRHIHIGKLLGGIALVYLLFAILSCILVPLWGKKQPAAPCGDVAAGIAGAERVLCIDDNTDALLWRLRMIESAENELILSTFNFGNDNSGQDVMAALKQAADRGVHIQILLDGVYGRLALWNSSHFKALAAMENVEVKLYNPINPLTPWKINYRMHDKYLIADETVYMLGGRNTTDLFLGDYQEKQNIDRDVLVYTAIPDARNSIHQVTQYFEEIWALSCNKSLTYNPNSKRLKQAAQELDARHAALQAQFPALQEPADWMHATLETSRISFFHNPAGASNKAPALWNSLCEAMGDGEQILIQTPYIICDREMYRDLSQLTGEGRRIQILTNAVENGANPWGCTDYLNQKQNILKTGAEVFEFIGDHSLHAKTVLIDDTVSLIGSFNMDMRSAYLDTETMLLIESPELNAALRQNTEEMIAKSNHVYPDGTETSGPQYVSRSLGPVKTVTYSLLRLLILPFRHLL